MEKRSSLDYRSEELLDTSLSVSLCFSLSLCVVFLSSFFPLEKSCFPLFLCVYVLASWPSLSFVLDMGLWCPVNLNNCMMRLWLKITVCAFHQTHPFFPHREIYFGLLHLVNMLNSMILLWWTLNLIHVASGLVHSDMRLDDTHPSLRRSEDSFLPDIG